MSKITVSTPLDMSILIKWSNERLAQELIHQTNGAAKLQSQLTAANEETRRIESLYMQSNVELQAAKLQLETLKQGEWVRCEDRLPEKEDVYLIYPEPKYVDTVCYFNIHSDVRGHKKNTFETESEYEEVTQHTFITHWMPLPPPPLAKESKG